MKNNGLKMTDGSLAEMYGVSLKTIGNYKASSSEKRLIYDAMVARYEYNLSKDREYKIVFEVGNVIRYSECPHRISNTCYFKLDEVTTLKTIQNIQNNESMKECVSFDILCEGKEVQRGLKEIYNLLEQLVLKHIEERNITAKGIKDPQISFSRDILDK